jgi:hypothetical protein
MVGFFGLFVGIIVACVCGFGYLRYGSIFAVGYIIRGDAFLVDQSVVDLGEFTFAKGAESGFRITNLSGTEMEILGGRINCGCAELKGMPLRIEPGGVGVVCVVVRPQETDQLKKQAEKTLDLDVVLFSTSPKPFPKLKVVGTARYE